MRLVRLYKRPGWSYIDFKPIPWGHMADTTSLHLRLPKGLYKRLQRQAKRNHVSLNTEIVNQLSNAKELALFTALLRGAKDPLIGALVREAFREIFVREGRAVLEGEKRSELPSSVIGTEDQK